jgi:hypothetical protein
MATMSDETVMGSDKVKGSPNGAKKCYEFGHRNKAGLPCGANVIAGTTGCWRHAGKKKDRAKAEGQVALELKRWGLNDTAIDPGVVMVRLVSQSAERVALYADLLGQAYEAAERLKQAHDAEELIVTEADADLEHPEDPSVQAARQDLRRIFTTGGVAALIGYKFDADRDGRIYATEEAVRGLAKLEAEERDRCASFATKAIAAGLAERQVRLAERQGALMASTFRGALDDADVPAEVRARIEQAFMRRMSLVAGDRVIEGSAA